MKIEKWSSELPKHYGVFWWRKEKGPSHYLLQLVGFGREANILHALDVLGHLPRIRGPRFVKDLGGEWMPIMLPGLENEPDEKATVPT